ncbi:hypothetical protein R5R35_000229 [Gryllus longicercus]|uniref:Fatty acid synthase n=3 Tax=Gryllus longicercus TaxID=2509291 RepID=A0AAN9ZI61_9ORTH
MSVSGATAAAAALRADVMAGPTAAGAPYWSPRLARSRRMVNPVKMDDYDKQGCLHDMFAKQALATPNATAIVTHDGRKMTFEELNNVTDILALHLRHLGVKRNTVVGILMDRCLEYAISYIAILKAGGAYLPLEISYPQSLLQSVLQDAEPVAVCTKKLFTERLNNHMEKNKIIIMENDWIEEISKNEPISEPVEVGLDDMAYTVYSSGTTGKPKGIQCPHRGAVFSYHWRHISYPYKPDDREACNIFFVWEMLRPLLKGIPLYIVPDDVIYDPPRLVTFLKENKITRMLFTPSLLQALLDFKGLELEKAFQSMRQIWFCGEVLTTLLKERISKLLPKIQLVNLYSVSECHDLACADLSDMVEYEQRKFCPVGKVLPGVHIIIMDEELNIQPVGAPGEIYVGGPTLAIGYLNRPEVTAQRFIARPDHVPAHVGERLYRTGDWGYMLSDGNLEICGRCDSMVKIRGYSIELQAVETALLDLTMVNTGCVLALGDEGSEKILVAYIVPEGKTSRKEVRAALKRKLPFYMIPSKFVFLNSIPIVEASGKLDKSALPKIDASENSGIDPQDLPSTPMEHEIAKIWCKVLRLPAVDVQESFFDLGGHSLLATRLLSEMNEHLALNLVLTDLFSHPTIQSMASFIEDPVMANGGEHVHLDLEAEVDRHDQGKTLMDIRLRAFWRSFQLSNKWRRDKILLTGVTGYVGAFLLKELLTTTKATVYCLVRQSPGLTPQDRVIRSLRDFGIFGISEDAEELEKKIEWRVVPIKGDITLVNLGMTEDDYAYLSYEIDTIIHAAATVNLIYPYRALHSSNVLGTENILNFAQANKIKPVHHISTDAVFPPGLIYCSEDSDMSQYADQLTSGYSQSKWVAEQLVFRAKARGHPVSIYRCGNVAGPQDIASWNPADFTLLMLQGCIHSLTAPDINWQIELTPVDFVSRVIVTMVQDLMQSIGKVFHLTNTNTMDSQLLWQLLRVQGYELSIVPYNKWYDTIKTMSQDDSCKAAGSFRALLYLLDNLVIEPSFFSNMTTFTQDNLQHLLKLHNMEYPPVNAELMRNYLRYLARINLIPRPHRKRRDTAQLLHGLVALVTGASSGIGAAIGEHLAVAGAKVALAARRIDRLQKLQKQIEGQGGMAVCVEMDVCNTESVNKGVKYVENLLGPVDILVNNAGVMYYSFMKNTELEDWKHMVNVNINGTLNCLAAVLGGMVERKQGHIVNISSDAGRKAFAGLAIYSGTKWFIEAMSQALRQEVVDAGIKVTCIQPGDVKTELQGHTKDKQAQEMYDMSSKTRILEPSDVAQAVMFAVTQPGYCAVNEILVEPREAPL